MSAKRRCWAWTTRTGCSISTSWVATLRKWVAWCEEAKNEGLRGMNVTYPCKQLVVPDLDELSPEAAELGAVNTIVFTAGRQIGHNTDSTGFQEAFGRGLPDARIDRVVLLGAGGAGAAVARAMLSLGAGHLTVLDADPERAGVLVDALGRRDGEGVDRGGRHTTSSPSGLPGRTG